MKSFLEYLTEARKPLTRKQLLEGGNAIKKSSRINQKNVDATLDSIYSDLLPKLGISKKDTAVLGSTGKKDPNAKDKESKSSGDIDLAISLEAIKKANDLETKEDVFKLLKKVSTDYVESAQFIGLDVSSIAFPIANVDGEQPNKFVQLDLIPVEDLKYAAWSYHSPAFDESEFKALYPKEIYYACAKHALYEITEGTEENPITWNRYFFDLAKGLLKGSQTIKSKTGKTLKKPESFDKGVFSTDPSKITKTLFGPKFKPTDVLTWEQCWEAIHSDDFILKDKLEDIKSMVKDGIKNKGYPLPKSLA